MLSFGKQKLEKELKNRIAAFAPADFGGETVTSDLSAAAGKTYPAPPVFPVRGGHPRVLFNRRDIPGIRREEKDPRSAAAVTILKRTVGETTDGDFGVAEKRNDKFYNFKEDVLKDIQALAFDYAVNGETLSGYRAVFAMKNALKTMDFRDVGGDQCRQFGFLMFTAACVYDWCHDLMTDLDKRQIVAGVQHKCCEGENDRGARMEVGFPPAGQGMVSGHGTELQILRDYLSFAVAIYDEYPGWWDFIGGRFYAEYVPARNEFYRAGMYPQGTSLYISLRFTADLFSALIVKAMSGTIPYDEEGMKQVARTVFSYELPSDWAFASGDDHTTDRRFHDFGYIALLSSHLFGDATMRAQLEYFKRSYSDFGEYFTSGASAATYLICSSTGVKAAPDSQEGMPLLRYNGGWLGQIIARSGWGDDQAAVLMKIGCRSAANHEHNDAGQFQIFYRTMLAGDTGSYDKYGDPHHYWYHQATVAHNSLLIYNPALAGEDRGYYSGGQTHKWECHDLAVWKSDREHLTGTVTGMQVGYADAAETKPTYAYIAGDITPAYHAATVSLVSRRMLTVFDTQNADAPLFFFVFDRVTATDPSFKKTFLLHVPTEPVLDGKTVTVASGAGKLVLQNLFGGDEIKAVGGEGKNYLVNGAQLAPCKNGDDGFWGRVELSPAPGSATDDLLNVFFATDADKTPSLPATPFATDEVKGAVIGDVAAVFVTAPARRETAFTFTLPGSDPLTCYVSGVKAGAWTVTASGSAPAPGKTLTATATEDGGLLTFTALAGTVTLTLEN
ncbi:MAG: heparinase II/III family protein [Clostridia bacterium]|nr:heparinase II/III family protein [Clostridia bacterium]